MHIDSDQVTLEPEAGDRLRRLLTAQIDQVDGWLKHLSTLAQRAPLGANPVGEAMAGKFELRAHGAQASFDSVLLAYRDVLAQTLDAVSGSIHSTQHIDGDYHTTFTDLGRTL